MEMGLISPGGEKLLNFLELRQVLSTYQYSWASLVAQLVKILSAMREMWIQSLGWEDPLEKGKATQSSILAWRIPYSPWGRKESDMTERLSLHFTSLQTRGTFCQHSSE